MKEKLTYLFSFLIMALIILLMFASFDYKVDYMWGKGYNAFANSDSSLLYQVSVDFLKHPASIFDWDFGTCFYFFPNLLIMLIATIIFSNPSVVVFAASIIQFAVLIILVNILFKKIFKSISKYTLIISNFSILLLIINTLIYGDFCTLTSHLFIPMHLGALINAIAALIIVFKYLEINKRKYLTFLIILSVIAIFSDLIYIVYFSIPLILGLFTLILFKKKYRAREYIILVCSLILSVIIGFALHRIINIANILSVMTLKRKPENVTMSFQIMMQQFYVILTDNILSTLIVLSSLISLILSTFIAVKIFCSKKQAFINASNNFLIYFIFILFSYILTMIAPVINGNYIGFDCIRYIIPPVYLTIFNVALLIDFLITSRRKSLYLATIAITILLVYSSFIIVNAKKYNPFNTISKVQSYYPSIVKATDDFSIKYHVKNGLGTYWDARFITNFSKQNVNVDLIRYDFHPQKYANNLHSYYYSTYSNTKPAVYNFIVLQHFDDSTIVYKVFDEKDIKKISIDGYGFYLLPDFRIKKDFSGFELVKNNLTK